MLRWITPKNCRKRTTRSFSFFLLGQSHFWAFIELFFYSVVGGGVASWLLQFDCKSSNPSSRPGQGHCVVFMTRHLTLTVPPSTHPCVYCKWVPTSLMLGVTLRWTSIPSRGSRNIPSRFMLCKLG